MTPATVLTSATVREALKRELCVERGEQTGGFIVAQEDRHVVVAIEQPMRRRALFTGCGEMDPAEMLWQLMECEAVLLGAGFTVERDGDELRVTA